MSSATSSGLATETQTIARTTRGTVRTMSGDQARDASMHELRFLPLDEAIRSAVPWDWDAPSNLVGISDDEWNAFIAALESR